jgi:hypothetical protein
MLAGDHWSPNLPMMHQLIPDLTFYKTVHDTRKRDVCLNKLWIGAGTVAGNNFVALHTVMICFVFA